MHFSGTRRGWGSSSARVSGWCVGVSLERVRLAWLRAMDAKATTRRRSNWTLSTRCTPQQLGEWIEEAIEPYWGKDKRQSRLNEEEADCRDLTALADNWPIVRTRAQATAQGPGRGRGQGRGRGTSLTTDGVASHRLPERDRRDAHPNGRVAGSIAAPGSHGSGRDSLPSPGSSHRPLVNRRRSGSSASARTGRAVV